jgi:hypothetical protein
MADLSAFGGDDEKAVVTDFANTSVMRRDPAEKEDVVKRAEMRVNRGRKGREGH